MATKREVDFWKDQCRELTAALDRSREDKHALTARIWDNSEEAKTARAIADGLEWQVEELEAENAKLRELCERAAIELRVNGNVTDAMTEKLLDDMRELGVEVSDA